VSTILGVVSGLISIMLFLAGTFVLFYKWGYSHGFEDVSKKGYLAGRRDADNWWLGMEAEANRARQEIGGEEDAA